MADQSIWKKEVSFVRNSDEPMPEPAESERPVWRQELSFVRKLNPVADADETAAPEAAAEEPDDSEQPVWKQELSFVRNTKADDDADENAAPEPAAEELVEEDEQEPAPTDDLSLVPGTVPETGSEEPRAEPATVVELPVAAAAAESGPEIAAEDPVPVAEEEQEPGPTDDLSIVPGTVPETGLEQPSAEPVPVVELPVAAAPVQSEPEIGPEEPVDEEPVWMRAVTFGSKAESQAPADEVGLDEPGAEAEPEPEPEPQPEAAPAETWNALAWLAEPVSLPERQAEAPPVGARDKRGPLLVGGCVGLLVAALLGALFMIGSGRTASAERNLRDLNRQVEALAPTGAGPAAAQSGRVSALTAALASRISWDRAFRDFALALPQDVRLTSLTATSAGGGTVPPMVTIRGQTSSHQSLATLLSRLRAEPDLANVQLISSARPQAAGRPVEFTVAADIASPGGGGS